MTRDEAISIVKAAAKRLFEDEIFREAPTLSMLVNHERMTRVISQAQVDGKDTVSISSFKDDTLMEVYNNFIDDVSDFIENYEELANR